MTPDELKSLKEAQEKVAREFKESTEDKMALESFRIRKTVDYFNEKAKANPVTAEDSRRLSKIFSDAARVDADLTKTGRSPTPEEIAIMDKMDSAIGKLEYSDLNGITAYTCTKIDEFIAESPERWERMERNMPRYTASIKAKKG